MESSNFASGDFTNTPAMPRSSISPRSPRHAKGEILDESSEFKEAQGSFDEAPEPDQPRDSHEAITADVIEEKESKMKDRIEQCRNIIESLKLELSEEKSKFSRDAKLKKFSQSAMQPNLDTSDAFNSSVYTSFDISATDKFGITGTDFPLSSNVYSACVDSKLTCDMHLMEYEKQLQQYQNTLNMAQIEKKNAIRKQMLAKAFRLKLLEVENQCNIELLRVKQSMQCLEPLQIIADNWKNDNEDLYNPSKFQLTLPQYPELGGGCSTTRSDINSDPKTSGGCSTTRSDINSDPKTPEGDKSIDQNTSFSSEICE